jgi:hypothetical protein
VIVLPARALPGRGLGSELARFQGLIGLTLDQSLQGQFFLHGRDRISDLLDGSPDVVWRDLPMFRPVLHVIGLNVVSDRPVWFGERHLQLRW